MLTHSVSNQRIISLCFILIVGLFCAQINGAVLVKDKRWDNGSTLNVVFLDGPSSLHHLVKQIAPVWLEGSSLRFAFYTELESAPSDTHIRISFESHSGSQLGNHRDYNSRFPTMNLKTLSDEQISDKGSIRLILHEFGHALGFEHEYRNQDWPYGEKVIKTITQDCYTKMENIGYSEKNAITHCKAINNTVEKDTAFSTAYDELSIMNYAISFTDSNGQEKSIKPTFKLSFLDKYAITRWYNK